MEVDESDTASYKYSPLTQPDTIRLIKLRPSHDRAAMIRCDLIPSALGLVEDNIVHQYIALSYVWGDLSDRDIILVNGMALMVTRSLIRTLMLLRDDRRVLYLWIDAICINQKDNLEKEQQVQNMGRIYELAQHTVIFLGECDPVTEALIAQSLERIKLQLNVRREVQLFQALQRLLEKPWFRRVWVFQEFVLSRDPRIQFGSIRYKWAHFHSLVTHLFDKISNLDSDVDYGDVASPPFYRELAKRLPCYTTNILEVIDYMQTARTAFQLSRKDAILVNSEDISMKLREPEKLLAVLASRRGLGVSDPRDMIFAHIGIFKGTGITPRYDRSTVHLYEEIVKYYYNLTSGLEMLHYVEDVDPNSRRKNLASWAPDWTYNSHLYTISIFHYTTQMLSRGSGGSSNLGPHQPVPKSTIVGQISWLDSPSILTAPGMLPYRVAACTSVIDTTQSDESRGPLGIPHGFAPAYSQEQFGPLHAWWSKKLAEADITIPLFTKLRANTDLQREWLLSDRLLHHILAYWTCSHQRPFCIFDGRRITLLAPDVLALIPASSRQGDRICLIKGWRFPFVVREMETGDFTEIDERIHASREHSYTDTVSSNTGLPERRSSEKGIPIRHVQLIGECFVDGLMLSNKEIPSADLVILAIH